MLAVGLAALLMRVLLGL
ncbi:MAG TPA: hypothetical protein VL154_15505 [Acetobacteraceae bacterium]|nr:hypothetical protein [Acetobacteraceae bacterium]